MLGLLLLLSVLTASEAQVTFLTGVSRNHFHDVIGLLRTLNQHEPDTPILLYDLGLTTHEARWLKDIRNVEYRSFPFTDFPEHFAVDEQTYAWKPLIVAAALQEHEYVVYMDASDVLNAPILSTLLPHLKATGFYSTLSFGTVGDWTHSAMLRYFHVADAHLGVPPCNAAFLAFYRAKSQPLVKDWADCAMKRKCIAPLGSSRSNHRQDQAALTLLVLQSNGRWVCAEKKAIVSKYSQHVDYRYAVKMPRRFGIGIPTTLERVTYHMTKETNDSLEQMLASVFYYGLTHITDRTDVLLFTASLSREFVWQISKFLGYEASMAVVEQEGEVHVRTNNGPLSSFDLHQPIVFAPTAVLFDLIREGCTQQMRTNFALLDGLVFWDNPSAKLVAVWVNSHLKGEMLEFIRAQPRLQWTGYTLGKDYYIYLGSTVPIV